ncbi:MAG: DUF2569 domain-containing protein [Clostridia bacterium]|nr:DUF2569 domain-containing protein [Clostridia bacterium]
MKSLEEPKGIGGWLGLVAIHIIIWIILLLIALFQNIAFLTDVQTLSTLMTVGHPYFSPYWASVITAQATIQTLLLVFTCVTAYAFFKKKREAKKYMIVLYVVLPLSTVIYNLIETIIPFIAAESSSKIYSDMISQGITSIIWVTYFMRSRRVNNTFVN